MICNISNTTVEAKCYRTTLKVVNKSIDKGNELLEKLLKTIKENDKQKTNLRKH